MPDELQVRLATERDADTLALFNRALAAETEDKELAPATIEAGVLTFLREPSLGFYLVAETRATVAGALMITFEWSDWRNGLFWWIQSVYVRPEFRRRGVFRQLYRHVEDLASSRGGVCGLRLYVERENGAAQRTYASLGMAEARYQMFEKMFEDGGVRTLGPSPTPATPMA